MKAYIEHNGVKYYGYEVFSPDLRNVDDVHMIMNASAVTTVRNLSSLVDTSIKPPKGAAVNVIQNCVLPVATIRNNYTIKRGVDTADYNVFSPQNTTYFGWIRQILLYPKEKAVLIHMDKNMVFRDMVDELQTYLPHAAVAYDDCIFIDTGWQSWYKLCSNANQDAFCRLLEGTLTKPCVSYNQLDLSTDNELTKDTLFIIYKLGITKTKDCAVDDMLQKLSIQIKALEQMNIDLYPGTMSLLNAIFCNSRRTVGEYLHGTSSRYDKTTKRLLSMNTIPKTNVDLEMGQSFIEMLLDMQDIKFTRMDTLINKLASINLPLEVFANFYNNIVKITKRTADE